MTDTVTNKKYERIEWTDIRDGDVLFHENGDRLTVNGRERTTVYEHDYVIVLEQPWSTCRLADAGFTPYRKQPELPTTPGAYIDKDGDYWLLDRSGNWYDWMRLDEPDVWGGNPQKYAPFTRLVPLPTEDAVHAAVYNALRGSAVDGMYPLRTINAVMALLGGDDA